MGDANGGRVDVLEGRMYALDAARVRRIDALCDRVERCEGMLGRICDRLGVASDAPPAPPIEQEFDRFRASDAEISTKMQAVEALAAQAIVTAEDAKQTQTKTWGVVLSAATAVRDGTPAIVKTLGKIAAAATLIGAAAGGLLVFAKEVWSAFHGH